MNLRLTREQQVADRLLSRYGDVGNRLDANLETLDRVESRRFNITATLGETVMSSGDGDKMGNALASVERHIEAIEADAIRLEELYDTVHGLVEQVSVRNRSAALVLSYWYESQLPARAIAKKVNCSEKTVYEHLKRGLDLAFDVLAEEGGF